MSPIWMCGHHRGSHRKSCVGVIGCGWNHLIRTCPQGSERQNSDDDGDSTMGGFSHSNINTQRVPKIEPCSVIAGDGPGAPLVRGYKIVCGKCGSTWRVPLTTTRGAATPGGDDEMVERRVADKAQDLGWVFGRRAAEHRCPACRREMKHKQLAFLHSRKRKPAREELMGDPVPLNVTRSELKSATAVPLRT